MMRKRPAETVLNSNNKKRQKNRSNINQRATDIMMLEPVKLALNEHLSRKNLSSLSRVSHSARNIAINSTRTFDIDLPYLGFNKNDKPVQNIIEKLTFFPALTTLKLRYNHTYTKNCSLVKVLENIPQSVKSLHIYGSVNIDDALEILGKNKALKLRDFLVDSPYSNQIINVDKLARLADLQTFSIDGIISVSVQGQLGDVKSSLKKFSVKCRDWLQGSEHLKKYLAAHKETLQYISLSANDAKVVNKSFAINEICASLHRDYHAVFQKLSHVSGFTDNVPGIYEDMSWLEKAFPNIQNVQLDLAVPYRPHDYNSLVPAKTIKLANKLPSKLNYIKLSGIFNLVLHTGKIPNGLQIETEIKFPGN